MLCLFWRRQAKGSCEGDLGPEVVAGCSRDRDIGWIGRSRSRILLLAQVGRPWKRGLVDGLSGRFSFARLLLSYLEKVVYGSFQSEKASTVQRTKPQVSPRWTNKRF